MLDRALPWSEVKKHRRFLAAVCVGVVAGNWAVAVIANFCKAFYHGRAVTADVFQASILDFAPLGGAAIVAASLLIEARILGWDACSLKRLLERKTQSVRTDVFYLILFCSNAVILLEMLFSGGLEYYLKIRIQERLGWALLKDFPWWGAFAAQWFAGTFVFYWQHWIQHRSAFLWEFHKLHHAAEEMDMANNFRGHPLMFVVRRVSEMIPGAILGVPQSVLIAYSAITGTIVLWQHADLDWNMPWIEKYILIGGRGHRIHHSIQERHYNKNMGSFLFWDWLFGTLYREADREPISIGVDDPAQNRLGPVREMFFACSSGIKALAR